MRLELLPVIVFSGVVREEPRSEEISGAKACGDCLCKGVDRFFFVSILTRERHAIEEVVRHEGWKDGGREEAENNDTSGGTLLTAVAQYTALRSTPVKTEKQNGKQCGGSNLTT